MQIEWSFGLCPCSPGIPCKDPPFCPVLDAVGIYQQGRRRRAEQAGWLGACCSCCCCVLVPGARTVWYRTHTGAGARVLAFLPVPAPRAAARLIITLPCALPDDRASGSVTSTYQYLLHNMYVRFPPVQIVCTSRSFLRPKGPKRPTRTLFLGSAAIRYRDMPAGCRGVAAPIYSCIFSWGGADALLTATSCAPYTV